MVSQSYMCVSHDPAGHSGKQPMVSQSYMRVSHDPATIFLGIWEGNESVFKGLYVDIHSSLVHDGQNQKQPSLPVGKWMISNFFHWNDRTPLSNKKRMVY